MAEERRMITAADIDNGNMLLQLDREILRALDDIADRNKKSTKTRRVTLEISFAPSDSRREAQATYHCKMTPAIHIDREKTTVFIDKNKKGETEAAIRRLDQPALLGMDDEESKALDIAPAN